MTTEPRRREARLGRPSILALAVVLVAAAVGAVSLVRQRPDPRLATPVPPPAWALAGHDAARSGHSLSYPTKPPITRLWWLKVPLGVRGTVVDGGGNSYLARPDGALLALDSGGNTRWCAAMQPITDTSCSGTLLPPAPHRALPPVTPNPTIIVGPDSRLYIMVVGAGGVLRAFVPSSPRPLQHRFPNLVPADGVVYRTANATLYGVVAVPQPGGPAHAIVALHWPGNPLWRSSPLPSRALTPVSVAPDGTLLAAASAPHPGGAATLYAIDAHGHVSWHVPLAPGRPSAVAVQGPAGHRIAWVAVAGAERSWVVAVDVRGHTLWRWSTGHPLNVLDGGVSLAHHAAPQLAASGPVYVGSTVGVYALDLSHHHAWLFFDTRAWYAGAAGPPTTDASNTVYVGTQSGWVYDLYPNGKVRWRYDTGRDARSAPTLAPDGTVLVVSHGPDGDVVEALGKGGQPVQTVGPVICAQPDCPTATATLTATSTVSTTVPLSPTVPLTSTVTPGPATAAPTG